MNLASITIITDNDFSVWASFLAFGLVGTLIGRGIGGKIGFIVAMLIWATGSLGTVFIHDHFERERLGLLPTQVEEAQAAPMLASSSTPAPIPIAKPPPDPAAERVRRIRETEAKYSGR